MATIIAIISAATFVYLIFAILNKTRITLSDAVALLMTLTLFVAMVKPTLFFKCEHDNVAMYNAGYNDAIKDATLVSSNDHVYKIKFGNDVHYYIADGAHLVDIKNINE